MFKQAWRSYLASLHPRNIKKIKNSAALGFWIYWLIISPIINTIEGEEFLFYAVNLTPYMIAWWSNLGHRLSMPKQMYLLPMQALQKAEYVRCLLIIKIGFPTLIGVTLHIIRGFIYGIHPFQILACVMAMISFGIGMYVCSELRSKYDRYIRYAVRAEDGNGIDAFLNWICMIYSAIYHLTASFADVEIGEGNSLLILALWYIIPLVPMIVMDFAII